MSSNHFWSLLLAHCLLGCIDDTDVCLGRYEIVIQELPPDTKELEIQLEFGSNSIEASCQDAQHCGASDENWLLSMGLVGNEDRAYISLDDGGRQSSRVPREVTLALSIPNNPEFSASRTFEPEVERVHDCESALDVWYLD